MSDKQQHTDAHVATQTVEQLRELQPTTLETIKRQTIAFLYAIGKAEGVEYRVVTIRPKEKEAK